MLLGFSFILLNQELEEGFRMKATISARTQDRIMKPKFDMSVSSLKLIMAKGNVDFESPNEHRSTYLSYRHWGLRTSGLATPSPFAGYGVLRL